MELADNRSITNFLFSADMLFVVAMRIKSHAVLPSGDKENLTGLLSTFPCWGLFLYSQRSTWVIAHASMFNIYTNTAINKIMALNCD